MFRESSFSLTPFLRPEWLAILPLAVLPLLGEWLRPIVPADIAAGWRAGSYADHRRASLWRWVTPALLAIGAAVAITALGRPAWPVFGWLGPKDRGHFWSVVLDCSGSMSIVDPGRDRSRLTILADDLAKTVQARPHDRFALTRVAGYADRVGPAASSSRFLIDRLRNIAPAQPGEDGTNLGDGLVLAAEALPPNVAPGARSILIVSDGRENPPDDRAMRLASIAPRLIDARIRVDWLCLDLPDTTEESHESRRRGEASRAILERLAKETGGSVVRVGPDADRSALFSGALAKFENESAEGQEWPTASTALAFLSFVLWSTAGIWLVSRWWQAPVYGIAGGVRALALFLALGGIGGSVVSAITAPGAGIRPESPTRSRAILLLDTSPSMAATDAAGGSRLSAAVNLARALIGRWSVEPGTKAAVVRFSGRAIEESGWTDDWRALESSAAAADTSSIRPTGSDWDVALRTVLSLGDESAPEVAAAGATGGIRADVFVLTDGEASRVPGEDVVAELARRGWQVSFVTFGDDHPPGATFRGESPDRPWIDRRTGQPARSARDDTLADRIAQRTGGSVQSVGMASFDAWELAEALIGPINGTHIHPRVAAESAPQPPVRYLFFGLTYFLISELCLLFSRLPQGHGRSTARLAAIAWVVIVPPACSPVSRTTEFETATESAWATYRQGLSTEARAMLMMAARRLPDEPAIPYDLALVELGRNRADAALDALNEAGDRLRKYPGGDPVRRALLEARIAAARGYAEILAGRPDAASKSLAEALSLNRLTEAETTAVEINSKFAQAWISKSIPPDDQANGGGGRITARPPAEVSKAISNTSAAEWQRLADEVRGRARADRAEFEPAGDETSPAPRNLPGTPATIDW